MDAADRRALDLFAAHAAAAVERVRTLQNERRRAHQAERMVATLASVGAASTLEEGLAALVRGAIGLLGGSRGSARVRDPDTDERLVSVSVESDGSVTVLRPAEAPLPGSYSAAIESNGSSALIEDFWALDPQTYPYYAEKRRAGLRSGVVVPIDASEKRIGSLHFDHPTPGYFTRMDVSLAETIASYAGLAISRLRLEEDRNQRSRLDGAMLVARTVAHEINNALAPVVGYAELLGQRPAVAADPQSAAFTKLICSAAEDAAAKVARLQRIVRLQEDVSPLGPSQPILDMERSTG
jgi:GAF domain-containing protein